jgi:SAM-dependent methyltransferase
VKAADAASLFDAAAERYDAAHERRGEGRLLRSRMAAVLRLLGSGPGELLDAGMGPGRLAAALTEHGWSVAGVDLSQEMVTRARRRLPARAERFHVAPVERLPFGDASFDAVVATGVIEYVEDPKVALRELARVLRPGGRAVVSCPNAAALPLRVDHAILQRVRRRPAKPWQGGAPRLERLLADAGLAPERREACAFRLVPRVLARIGAPLDRLVEGRDAFATQIVVFARKT